ncbi:MAG: hypothetical protein H7Y86_16945 [Rhizobacter sp.]|nr:hypothetical protein [Ferruginibacter sp.]
MYINLNNYEQYLLMYVDNELSADGRMRVEAFLTDYPYLKPELEILQQTVLPLENVLFDKSSLLKPILDEATQEKLLMRLDGELPAGESLALQNSLKADKMLSREWATLQKTKLDAAEIIEHPDKESLYRRERTSIITGRFVRLAVAAMLLGAGFYAGVNLLNNNKTTGTGVARNNPGNKTDTVTGINDQNNTAAADPVNTNIDQSVVQDVQDKATPLNKEDAPLKNNLVAVKDDEKDKEIVAPITKEKTNSPSPERTMTAGNQSQDKKTIPVEPKELPQRNTENVLQNNNEIAAIENPKSKSNIELPTNINTNSKPVVDANLSANNNQYARTAALGFEENNQDQVLMMEEENVSRSKAAIFLKKLKRNVERRTNIKPGRSLRIAGFEFAVK